MTQEDKSMKEKIILATINCIEKQGIDSVTVRSIAKEAGVNIAAVNYYFGSKEKLLDKALKSAFQHATVDWSQMLDAEGQTPRSVLKNFLTYTLGGMLKFPNITKAHLYDAIVHNDYSGVFVKQFNALLSHLQDRIQALSPGRSVEETKLSIIGMISAIMLVGILPRVFRDFSEIDFGDAEIQEQYVDNLLRSFAKDL